MNKKQKIERGIRNTDNNRNKENNTLDQCQKDLSEILELLGCNKKGFNKDTFLNKIEVYIDKYNRILYSFISNYIYSCYINNNPLIDNFLQNLTLIIEGIDTSKKMSDTEKIVFKLYDHIMLAMQQFENLATTKDKIDPVVKDIFLELDNIVKEQSIEVENLGRVVSGAKLDYKNITTNLISIVSLFVGISFVMFGGMSMMSSLFSNLKEGSIPLIELLCLGALIGLIMISVMYGFILFMLRITERIEGNNYLYRNTFIIISLSLWSVLIFTLAMWYNKVS